MISPYLRRPLRTLDQARSELRPGGTSAEDRPPLADTAGQGRPVVVGVLPVLRRPRPSNEDGLDPRPKAA